MIITKRIVLRTTPHHPTRSQHAEYTEVARRTVNKHVVVSCRTSLTSEEVRAAGDGVLRTALQECTVSLVGAQAGSSLSSTDPAVVVMTHQTGHTAAASEDLLEGIKNLPSSLSQNLIGYGVHGRAPEEGPDGGEKDDPASAPALLTLTALFLPGGVEAQTTMAHRSSDGIPPLPKLKKFSVADLQKTYSPLIIGIACSGEEGSYARCLNMFPTSEIAFELPKAKAIMPEIYCRGERFTDGLVCAALYVKKLDMKAVCELLMLCDLGMSGRGYVVMTPELEKAMYLPSTCGVPHIPIGVCFRMHNLHVPKSLTAVETNYTQPPRLLGLSATQAKHSALCHLCSHPIAQYKDLIPMEETSGLEFPKEWEVIPTTMKATPRGKSTKVVVVKRTEMCHSLLFKRADVRIAPKGAGVHSHNDLTCPSCSFPVGHLHSSKRDAKSEKDEYITLNLKRITGHNKALCPEGVESDPKHDELLRLRGHTTILHDIKGDYKADDFFSNGTPLPWLPDLITDVNILPGQTYFVKIFDRSNMAVLKDVFNQGKTPHFGLPFVNTETTGVIAKVIRATFLSSPEGPLHVLVCARAVARCQKTTQARVDHGTQYYNVEKLTDEKTNKKDAAQILKLASEAAELLDDSWAKEHIAKISKNSVTSAELESLSFEILVRCPREVLIEAKRHFAGSSRDTLSRLQHTVSAINILSPARAAAPRRGLKAGSI